MSNYNNPQAYPPQGTAPYPVEPHGGNMAAPPPAGYPMKDEQQGDQVPNTQSKGDGFWKGCCAALCCYCLLDACF